MNGALVWPVCDLRRVQDVGGPGWLWGLGLSNAPSRPHSCSHRGRESADASFRTHRRARQGLAGAGPGQGLLLCLQAGGRCVPASAKASCVLTSLVSPPRPPLVPHLVKEPEEVLQRVGDGDPQVRRELRQAHLLPALHLGIFGVFIQILLEFFWFQPKKNKGEISFSRRPPGASLSRPEAHQDPQAIHVTR